MREQTAAEHEEVVALGGLHILGTERHESRRIDNQLRGRAGRQGDPGSSRFYLSLEDDLMRIFGGDRIKGLMGAMGMNDDEPIEAGMVTRAIERSQKRVEAHHFEIRKHLLEYDDVMNKQRIFFYGLRTEILKGNTKEYVLRVAGEIAEGIANDFLPDKGERDLAGFRERVEQLFTLTGEEVDAMGQHAPGPGRPRPWPPWCSATTRARTSAWAARACAATSAGPSSRSSMPPGSGTCWSWIT